MKQYKQLEIELMYLQSEDIVTASAVSENMTFTDVWDYEGGMF